MRISIANIKIKDRIRKDLGDLSDKQIDEKYKVMPNGKKIAKAFKDLRRSRIASEAKELKQRYVEDGIDGCWVCGFDFSEILQIHHIIPIKDGGNNDSGNVVIVCPNCHKALHKAYEYLRKDDADGMDEIFRHLNGHTYGAGKYLFLNCVVKYGERRLAND